MEASNIAVKDRQSANAKLQASDAAELLDKASTLIVAKGKKVTEFKGKNASGDDAVAAMLGPTGNLRAPAIRAGKTLLIGFNEEVYSKVFG